MYSIFNNFLDAETWYKDNAFDNERFYTALSKIVKNPDFSPDNMAEHMCAYKKIDKEENSDFLLRIESLQNGAWHIKDYLQCALNS